MRGRWLFVAVSIFALVPVVAFLLIILWMGFWQGNPGDPVVYTLKHYRTLFTDPTTYRTLLNTLGFASTTVLVSLLFAVPTAWLVERTGGYAAPMQAIWFFLLLGIAAYLVLVRKKYAPGAIA